MLEEVHASQLGYFLSSNALHPNISDFGVEALDGLQQRGQDLALAYLLFPEGLRQLVILGE